MGTAGLDLFIQSTRYVTDQLQVGHHLDYQERERDLPVHERTYEAGLNLTWWFSSQTQWTLGYTYQRIKNPGQISAVTPFTMTFDAGVTATNHLVQMGLVMEF
jgi:hypothetical protein